MIKRSLFLIFFTCSCSGYHFVSKKNPFSIYDIKTLAIPQFVNRSSIPRAASFCTKEFTSLLSSYPGLEIISGEGEKSDGILIGIVDGPQYQKNSFVIKSRLFTSDSLQDSIGQRQGLYLPHVAGNHFSLRLLLLKNEAKGSKILFDKTYPLSSDFTLSISSTISVDDPGMVNNTKNKRLFLQNIEAMAINAANIFKSEMIDAF